MYYNLVFYKYQYIFIEGSCIMPVVPLLRPQEVLKAFEKLGWEVACQKGSRIIIITKEKHVATLSIPKHIKVARGTTTDSDFKSRNNYKGLLECTERIIMYYICS